MKISVDHPNKPPSPNKPSLKEVAMSFPQSLNASPAISQSPSIAASTSDILSPIKPTIPPMTVPIAAPKGPAIHIPIIVPKPAPISVQLIASAICQPSLPAAQASIPP